MKRKRKNIKGQLPYLFLKTQKPFHSRVGCSLEQSALVKMLFLPAVSLVFLTIALCNSTPYEGRYLPGNALRILLDVDWTGCLQI